MNYYQISILLLQGLLVAFVILLLFKLRRRFGLGMLFACLGLFQFVYIFLSYTVYVPIANNFIVSPGSSVFFTATLFSLLIIYIKEDASEIKKIIYALIIVNIVMALLLQIFSWSLHETSTPNLFSVSTHLFDKSAFIILVGTIALFLDSLAIIIIFKFISKHVRFLFLQICITMLVVASVDTLFFFSIIFWDFDNLNSIIISEIFSKVFFVIFYSVLFYIYLKYIDSSENKVSFFTIKDVFQPLTYKQKFEFVSQEIKKTEELYRLIADNSNDLICLHNKGDTFKYISPSVKKILGYEQSELIKKPYFEIIHKEDVPFIKNVIEQIVVKKINNNAFSCRVLHKAGHFIWLEFTASVISLNNNGSYILTSARDITEKVLAKQEIKKALVLAEKREYSLKEASKVAKIGYWEYDRATDAYLFSDYNYHILGLDPKNIIPTRKEIYNFFDKESVKKLRDSVKELISKGTSYDIELKFIHPIKKEIWVRFVAQPIYNEQHKIIGRRGVLQDITDYKKIRHELEFSKQKLQTSLELAEKREFSLKEASKVAKIGYWEYDVVTDTCIWSDYIYHILGVDSKDGVLPRNEAEKIFDNEYQKKLKKVIQDLDSTGVSSDFELKLVNFKKKEIWTRIVAQPIYNEQHKIIGRRGVIHDITIQKIRQRELVQKNERLCDLFEALNKAQQLSAVGSWHWNIKTDKKEWSDEMYEIYGVTKGGFYPSNKNVIKTVLPEDLHKVEQTIISLLIDKKFTPFEFRIKRPSGEIRNLYIQSLEKKSKNTVFGVTMDITERKRIEENNTLIKEEYKELFENASISILNEDYTLVLKEIEALRKLEIPNIKTYLEQHPEVLVLLLEKVKVNKVNKATLKLFKAENNQEFLNKTHNKFGKGAEKVFGNLITSIWNKDKIFTSEINYKTLNGDEFAAIVSIPIPLKEAKSKIVPVSIQSIQNIKEAHAIKNESILKLNKAQKIAHVGSWLFTPKTQKREWSDEMFDLWDIELKKGAPENDTLFKKIYIDDQELFNSTFTDAITKGIPYDIEFRIHLSNGTQKMIRSICKPILGNNGELVRLTGTTQDITEQKQAIDKIKKAEEMYRLLTDNSNDLISLHEPNSTFKYISPSIKTILGYEPSYFLGKKPFSIIHNEDIKYIKDTLKKSMVSGKAMDAISFRILHKKGYYVWLEFLASPVYIDKKISYYVTSARDITLGVKARQKIEEYQRSLQKLTSEITLVEEKQKREIASNIHDHLSQSLVISKMRINELKKNPQLKVIAEDLKFIETHISEALENTRKITYELSPPVLYQLGIIEALNWLLEDIEETHKVKCNLNSNVAFLKLSDGKSILLYRSIQEVLTNIIKYAKTSFINLDLDKNKLGLHILVTDNGVGFDTSVLNNYQNHTGSGFGLFTVQERIKNIQGTFMITSQINVGTTVKIFIPLSK